MICLHKWSSWVVVQYKLYTKIPQFQSRECIKCGKTQVKYIYD
ncbi:hypothetical protein SEA_WOFFORD_278 [Streptomyces phage Wofford]|uniref:Uncharacterized protein n=1 Tax=Streptomyces phage Wofford TaxID=2283267 RepID=A0A345M9P7_9CAUD|nr:hypothetical protein HWB78_gp020 [Streptomyces phage Wollford]YP_009839921.1 hypothetical protein HWB78_gp041 [Streptomyces phage Wollford]AXH67218.1 hypothetical protein SEA_WOFFORD_20 [Streptomyces phage Wollford]AXH67412.1 hypothetical protein SEA_WOFFORD_278 [Streptomyces phage Wollford]